MLFFFVLYDQHKNRHLNMSIPEDCVSEILSYMPAGVAVTKSQRQNRPEIRSYLAALRVSYVSQNLRYLNKQYQRKFSAGTPWRQHRRMVDWLPIYHIMPGPDGFCKPKAEKHYRHTCCALTRKGTRCRYKTFGLFCGTHQNATRCYWSVEPQNGSLEDFHIKGLQEAEKELEQVGC